MHHGRQKSHQMTPWVAYDTFIVHIREVVGSSPSAPTNANPRCQGNLFLVTVISWVAKQIDFSISSFNKLVHGSFPARYLLPAFFIIRS